jgi:meiotic recombination protein DMC1
VASEFNAAVLVTNLVMAEPSGMAFGPTYKAIGGHVLAHASTVRLAVRKGKAEQRVLKVVQAPSLPEAEASYCITDAGVCAYAD